MAARFTADRAERALILRIVKRFERIASGTLNIDRLGLLMDIEACHSNGCALDLIALNECASDLDLAHDVAGITRHINRESGTLEGHFMPRYAAPSSLEAA